jgi:hypothetical protein
VRLYVLRCVVPCEWAYGMDVVVPRRLCGDEMAK